MKSKKSPKQNSLNPDVDHISEASIPDVISAENEILNLAKLPVENPNPVMKLGFDGQVLYVNQAGEPFIKKWNISPGNQVPENIMRMVSGIAEGTHKDIEIECCCRFFSFTVVPIAEEGYINLYGHDITQLKMAEERLLESELRYKELVSNAKSIILKMDTKGRFTFFNEFAQNFFGYKEDEIIGKTAWQTIVPKIESSGRDLTKLIDNIYEDPDRFSVNINENTKRNGERAWIEWHNKALYDKEGKKTGHMAIGIDITRRKRSEDALYEAREKLNIALENAGIGVWEWNLQTGEVIWDEKLERMFGLEPGTFGRTVGAFENLVHEEDIPHINKSLKNTIEKGIPFETIYRTRSEKGKLKYISSKAFVNKDSSGNLVRFSGVCFDITGMRQETERLILELNEELLRSNKDLESFAYAASHDLQEPLRMVTSFTQMLERKYKDVLDEKGMEYIHFASDGAKRMYELLNGLLDYSRIHKKGKAFNTVNMDQVLDAVLKNLSFKIEEKNAVVKIHRLPNVIADESQMIQLFQNLISNSIKFSTKAPHIYVSCKLENNQFVFSVKDKGIGIESQYFDKIFQIFQRLHGRKNYEGTGIGLAICKSIVERHGGKIWVQSEPGKGSTFFFTIARNINE
jgi:PAS domain S-box-containing protein